MSEKLRILFVSRTYPPTVGGIEKQNYELGKALGTQADVTLIANAGGSKFFLPLFFLTSFVQALIKVRRVDIVLLGDGVLSVWGLLLKTLSGKPVCSVVHGLDITFRAAIYQRFWVRYALNRLDTLFAVGNATIAQAVARGVDKDKICFIPNGTAVFDAPECGSVDRSVLNKQAGKVYLLTLGRLVRRKGVTWFIREVLPKLPPEVHYCVAGDGPCKESIERLIDELGVADRVSMLGRVSDRDKAALLSVADIFVQSNIPVEGDIEGFGLVVLEAAAAGLPVVAARLEGLEDAIVDGENGLLLQPGDSDAFADCIRRLASQPEQATRLGERAKHHVETNCLWPQIAARYVEELSAVVRTA